MQKKKRERKNEQTNNTKKHTARELIDWMLEHKSRAPPNTKNQKI